MKYLAFHCIIQKVIGAAVNLRWAGPIKFSFGALVEIFYTESWEYAIQADDLVLKASLCALKVLDLQIQHLWGRMVEVADHATLLVGEYDPYLAHSLLLKIRSMEEVQVLKEP